MSSNGQLLGSSVLVSSPTSIEKKDGTVMVHVEPERFESSTGVRGSHNKNPIVRLLESSFLGSMSNDSSFDLGHEMKDIERSVKIVQSPNTKSTIGDFDICKEYNYSGDEEDHFYFQHDQAATHKDMEDEKQRIHLLGRSYHPVKDYAPRRDFETSLYWFTYRCDFPEIAPYGITSDAGWGCMLRSAMMLLAQALRIHFKGGDWKPPTQLNRRRQEPFIRSLLTWFADFPSKDSNIYSLHNMVAAGLDRQVLPGEWYGPGTACYVLRDLVELQERRQDQSDASPRVNKKIFRIHVAVDSAVYKSAVEELMTKDSREWMATERARIEAQSNPLHPLDNAWECELIELENKIVWDTALVLLIPLRLGLKTFNADYVQALAYTFSLPQSLGVLGGRPRGARWFYGAVADGSKIFGLDPHTVQVAPRKRLAAVNGKASRVVELSDDYLRSVHTNSPETFPLSKLDPSVALGFYCKDRDDFLDLLANLEQWKKEHPGLPEIFTCCDAAPDYSSQVVSSIDNMMSRSLTGFILDDEASIGSEEDDYVVL